MFFSMSLGELVSYALASRIASRVSFLVPDLDDIGDAASFSDILTGPLHIESFSCASAFTSLTASSVSLLRLDCVLHLPALHRHDPLVRRPAVKHLPMSPACRRFAISPDKEWSGPVPAVEAACEFTAKFRSLVQHVRYLQGTRTHASALVAQAGLLSAAVQMQTGEAIQGTPNQGTSTTSAATAGLDAMYSLLCSTQPRCGISNVQRASLPLGTKAMIVTCSAAWRASTSKCSFLACLLTSHRRDCSSSDTD